MVDVFLIRDGLVENIVVVPTIEFARQAYPGYTIVERTPENTYHADGNPVNPGDAL